MSAQDRFMIVQVLPYSNFTQGASDVFKMTVGAYAWVESNNFIRPTRGKDCVLTDKGASMTKASFGAVAAAIVAYTLY